MQQVKSIKSLSKSKLILFVCGFERSVSLFCSGFVSGTIDMDLITTGVSASERIRRANLLAALRELIADKISPGSSSGLKTSQVYSTSFDRWFCP